MITPFNGMALIANLHELLHVVTHLVEEKLTAA